MQAQNSENRRPQAANKQQESRSARFNVPVKHLSRWQLLFERLLSAPLRLHRYRQISMRMLEDTIDKLDEGGCR